MLVEKLMGAFGKIPLEWLFKAKYQYPAFVFFLIISAYTLGFSPLPWFDEVFFADMTHSLLKHGGLYLKFAPVFNKTEVLFYGPVYFWVQYAIAKLAGLTVVSFRSVNFLSGLAFLFVFRKYCIQQSVSRAYSNLISLSIFIDPVFQYNIHSGRMDFLATVLAFIGFIILNSNDQKKPYNSIIAGFLLAAGFLTTPRIIFFLIPAMIFLLAGNRQKRIQVFIASAISLIPIAAWIGAKFGNPITYFQFFLANGTIASHIGPVSGSASLWRYHYYLFWYFLVLISLMIQIRNWYFKRQFNLQVLFLFGVMVLFHLLVVEKGPYSAMVIPFYAGFSLLVFRDLDSKSQNSKVISGLYKLNFLFLALIFLGKSSLIALNHAKTNEQVFENQLPKELLQGKKVVGSFEYFYLLNAIDCHFYGFQLGSIPQRIRFHFEEVDFDYLLLSVQENESHQFIEYQRAGKLIPVARIKMPDNSGSDFARALATRFHIYLPDYSAVLYKRIRN
jgi:4-amino-4-deoxy-L-arabinose transferase-like glycosyltransferase